MECEYTRTYVDQGIDAAILHHVPGVLGRRNVGLAVQRNVNVGILVEEFEQPFEQAQ